MSQITPAMWQRMPWHAKSKAIARLDRENRDMERGYTAEQRRALQSLTQAARRARASLAIAEREIARLEASINVAGAVDDHEHGPERLAEATREADGWTTRSAS